MDRRSFLATTGAVLLAPGVGCLGADGPPWTRADPIEDPDAVHDLFVENHTDATGAAWIRVVRDDGATLVDGRYELPDGRGFEFESVAAWERTYTITLAFDGGDVTSLEWSTPSCGAGSETSGGSRDAYVRVEALPGGDEGSRVSLARDECDALRGPAVPVGAAETFRLDE